jgi:two-component system NarL family response regulator
LLAKGHSNKAIAKALDISMNTAKAHVKTIMRKLDSVTRTQAVVTTMDRGLIDDRELFNTAAN